LRRVFMSDNMRANKEETAMLFFKVKVFKDSKTEPDVTIKIPLGILRTASKLIPKKALSFLDEKGIDIAEIVKLTENDEIRGTLIEIDDHRKNEHIVILVE